MDVESLLKKVIGLPLDERGCKIWDAACSDNGYAVVQMGKSLKRAHREVYFIANPYADRNMYVTHDCDNPKCVNIAHLRLGTPKSNRDECIGRGRFRWGVLGMQKAREIRALADCVTVKELCRRYGVTHMSIRNIIYGKNYKEAA